ncbi:MAG: aminotransferase class I/II-fold pyridoxal phosphate-dependent enzyme [Croceitalea sp.]|nr:aminotransferase class I/II-fold pyridoxal phosphate-dependent enzyme [Croceitalea sp.]MBT8238620.1 aminotransferase class I/II-fold pyridoxal phosphate-dependent enzyme [Croceitalea sp.]NNC34523.1 aminotransferase class I/II-fold pyridoxal phosphate-dependent enzyme [Croceitalea sp.]NNL09254.1 aminotransferase class I/II-fold pyridoxal phosphate-dependent enzyme [Croceitalea sp.]NNM19037.1 aminotransferase class I/II-fold pyridoxal phosphate-dependent enzyme [Croceitalea sp.]
MKSIDRRKWLKTVGLTGGYTLLGGVGAIAMEYPKKLETTPDNPIAKLNSNENPFGPSNNVRAAITKAFDHACRYPSVVFGPLLEQIAATEGVSKDHIVITGGSTEGLKATGVTYGINGGEIIAAAPTFQAMLRYAENFGAYVHRVPVDEHMGHDLNAMASRINNKTRLIFICNPNNPTGTLLNKDELRDFCSSVSKKIMVFSDEAYYDFITEPDYPSMVELVKQGMNVIVSKTFSKVYGLAGMRIGYLVARPDIAQRLRANIMAMTNVLAIEAAKEALKDDEFYKFSILKNRDAKNSIYKTLNDLNLEYVKSHTNFIFFKTRRPIDEMITAMKNENVLIGRPFPPFYEWARISTGTDQNMKQFDAALKKVMG